MKRMILFAFFLTPWICQAQNYVEGIVIDIDGMPIPGANVIVNGTQTHTVTDVDGLFRIRALELPFAIVISSVGYQSQEIEFYELTDELFEIMLPEENVLKAIVVTSRRREEIAQQVPIPVSVINGALIDETGAFNVNRLKELVPTVQLYSSNPRNTTLNIRGMGSTFGLTNDGIDPGVGFYVDGVYYARPAAAVLDFVDVEQIEVLRGPQGTLFGKNTTAGAFNITTRAPSFNPEATFDLSYGNLGYIQAKSSVSGPILKDKIAVRASFSGTRRDGTIHHIITDQYLNDLNNLGARAQLLVKPVENIKLLLSADANRQRSNGYAQVIAGVAHTLRADYRQFDAIIADLNYTLPSTNPFDRQVDQDTPWRATNDLGGVSINLEIDTKKGSFTSTSSWRYWRWDPSNDRDFTGIPMLTLSQAPSRHHNWSQELRYSGELSRRMTGVAGVFLFGQELKADPYHTEEAGPAQWRFSQNTASSLWQTPGLLDGYGIQTRSTLYSFSGAAFANAEWTIADKFRLMPGVRLNYDSKRVDYQRMTYGGLQTDDEALLTLKRSVYTDQEFAVDVDDWNVSGQLTLAYSAGRRVNAFATHSRSYKPVGVNLGGLPTSSGRVMTELARVKPEAVSHFEVGLKTAPSARSTVNLAVYRTGIRDYQTLVQAAELGVNRGYLANADLVRVAGAELDASLRIEYFSFHAAAAFTDGKYVSFPNAPVPLEETGGETAYKDVSGGNLPGISRWSSTLGGEYLGKMQNIMGQPGKFFVGFDTFYRSSFSSSPSPSRYLNVAGYVLANGRLGFRATGGLSVSVWGRNLLGSDYMEQLLPGAGNAGHYAGVLGDPRTYGVTLKFIP